MADKLEIRVNLIQGSLLSLDENGRLKDIEPIAPAVKAVLISGADLIRVRGKFYKKIEDIAHSDTTTRYAERIMKYEVIE